MLLDSTQKIGFSSYLVRVSEKFSYAKQEELLINDASKVCSKKLDFGVERFSQSV